MPRIIEQGSPQGLRLWQMLLYQQPEVGRVVVMHSVTELVDHHIVHKVGR